MGGRAPSSLTAPEEGGWSLPTTLPDLRRGASLLVLLLRPEAWVSRRVESVSYSPEGLVRRAVSVDFQPFCQDPEILPIPSWGEDLTTILVPLALLSKAPLALLDVRDEAGLAIPVLGTEHNGFLAYSALSALATQVLPDLSDGALLDPVLWSLHRVALAPSELAVRVVEGMATSENAQLRALSADPAFFKLASDLARNFVLLAEAQTDPARIAARRILKFTYVTTPLRGRRSFLDWLWLPNERTVSLDVPSIGDAQSYHFQFCPPSSVHVRDCSLDVDDPFEGVKSLPGLVVGGTGHLHAMHEAPGSSGVAKVTVVATHQGVVASSLVCGGLNTVVILAFTAWACTTPPTSAPDPGGAWQALFLAIPALAGAFLANPGELGLLSRLLAGARAALLLSAVVTMMVALGLAVGVTGDTLKQALVAASVVSAACCTRLVQWFVRCRRVGTER